MSEEGFQGRKRDFDDCEDRPSKRLKKDDQIASNSSEMAEEYQRMKEKLSFLEGMFNSQSNERKKDSNDCEAEPSKKSKKNDSSMSKDVTNVSISNGIQSIDQIKVKEFLRMTNCGNVSNIYHGDAYNNSSYVVYNFNCTRESTNVIKDEESSIIAPKTLTKEVFPNDNEVMKLIWKYLDLEDKTDCTLVCNRFNEIISEMNCFRLVLQFDSMIQIIPEVSRSYKILFIQGYHCTSLSQEMHKMLKHLSQSVTDLTLNCCKFDIIVLSEFLGELPLLESLNLNVILTMDKHIDCSLKVLPNLLQLKEFHIKSKNKLNEILNITRSASNIQSLTLFNALFDENLIDYLIKYKKLRSLILNKCKVKKKPISDLNSLHFSSNVKQPSISKQSNKSVIDLTLDDCNFDFIAFSKFLGEFPLLESLKLNVFIRKNKHVELSNKDLPKLLQLKDFNIKPNDKLNEILDIIGSASNIQSLTLFEAIFDDHLIDYLTKYKNSLTNLSLTKCIVEKSFLSNLNSLHFGSNVKLPLVNLNSFNCLNELRKLELININNEVLGILNKKWAQQLEECTIIFNYQQVFDVDRYFTDGFYDHFPSRTFPDFEFTDKFTTPLRVNRKTYDIKCFTLAKKMMIEYFKPLNPNPTVDDNNNNMCYFKMTPITKTEDFIIKRRNNSIIDSSLLQDIAKGRIKTNRCEYHSCDYCEECKKEYKEWCAVDDEWYKEYYKCYKRDREWWEDGDEWWKDYDEWCLWDQKWYREYYEFYKREYEWWEDFDGRAKWRFNFHKEYDDWYFDCETWRGAYFSWYRDYHKCNKQYQESREEGFRSFCKMFVDDYKLAGVKTFGNFLSLSGKKIINIW